MSRLPVQFEDRNMMADWSLLGQTVIKRSGKPFKSGQKVATIRGFVKHPDLGITCFTFNEDDSYVACYQCVVYPNV